MKSPPKWMRQALQERRDLAETPGVVVRHCRLTYETALGSIAPPPTVEVLAEHPATGCTDACPASGRVERAPGPEAPAPLPLPGDAYFAELRRNAEVTQQRERFAEVKQRAERSTVDDREPHLDAKVWPARTRTGK